MKLLVFLIPAFCALTAAAQTAPVAAAPSVAAGPVVSAPPAAPRVAVIRFQDAILATQQGQQASAMLRAKYDPKKADVQKRQADLEALQEKLQKGAATMTPEARSKMQDELQRGARNLQHDVDDLNAELQQEEGKIMQDMAVKMDELIQKYARKNGFGMVLDVSSQQTPVLWADAGSNITAEIVKEYDAAYPAQAAAAAPKTGPK